MGRGARGRPRAHGATPRRCGAASSGEFARCARERATPIPRAHARGRHARPADPRHRFAFAGRAARSDAAPLRRRHATAPDRPRSGAVARQRRGIGATRSESPSHPLGPVLSMSCASARGIRADVV
jgi:hypothetical protein